MFVVVDKLHGLFDPVLDVGTQGPVPAQTQTTEDGLQQAIEPEQQDITMITEMNQPGSITHGRIKLIPMNHPEFFSIGGFMNGLTENGNIAQGNALIILTLNIIREQLIDGVMISANIADHDTRTRQTQDFLDDSIVAARPVPAYFESP